MSKTITSFNIRDYSTAGTGMGLTGAQFLQPFVGVLGGYICLVAFQAEQWLIFGCMLFNVVGGLLLLQMSHTKWKNEGMAKRRAFLDAWKSEFGHEAPTIALDNIRWKFTRTQDHRSLYSEAYTVDGVTRIVSVVNDGSVVLETTE